MKLTIKKELLEEAINKVSRAISTKNLVPALAGIKFDITKKGVTLTASDNNITIQTFIPKDKENMTIDEEGSIIIQGRYIGDIVRKLPDEFINIELVDDLKIVIFTDNSEYNLNAINKSEYPNIYLEENKNPIVIDSSLFKDLVNQTAFASSKDESRPVLTGINIKIEGKTLECNSTDSYRLARKVFDLKEESKDSYNIVIPSTNIVEFTKIMGDSEENVEMHIFNNKVLFKYGSLLFQSRLVNGTYPNTANLLPEESLLKINTTVDSIYAAIDRASILTSDKEKNIVTLETKGDTLYIRSQSAEIGRVEEKMEVSKNNKEEIRISFVAKYMLEALRSFKEDEVEISFVGEIKPIILKSNKDETLTQLVLPIRTY